MRTRTLGRGLTVTEVGLGCMGMSQSYGTPDDAESVATIHRALDLGVTFLDTADAYGPFTNGRLVGGAIKGRRGEIVLATKFGNQRRPDSSRTVNGRPEYVRQACGASLERLGTDIVLTPAELAALERAVPRDAAAGERYLAAFMAYIGR